ncbi:GyrI-like domain-containing protein [Brachybacterium sp. EF45031]|uniref:GyrI-like domain-containing protein n=1 Tax=Brachybacterium sillae TaxID=2810536 RepID=UPI00217D05E5|nr:GyrI-like domain-containing protein [Brachybacterium sillae]MCS6711498.1 GyrI-like domain-containing protein [Brachybacterium sillae]
MTTSDGLALHRAEQPLHTVEIREVPEVPTVAVCVRDWRTADMGHLMDTVFSQLPQALAHHGLEPAGPAYALYHRMPVATADIEVGFPVAAPAQVRLELDDDMVATPSRLPGGRVAVISHVGPYQGLAEAWGAFIAAVGERGERGALPFWEFYVTEPTPDLDPAEVRTDLVTLLA